MSLLEPPYNVPAGQVARPSNTLGGALGSVIRVRGGGAVQSEDFVTGSTGWRILASGDVEFDSGAFRGDITGATGTFAGSLIGGELHIPNDQPGAGLHVDSSGNMWWGAYASYAAALIKISVAGLVSFSSGTFSGSITGATGTFTGSITGASGTFDGSITGATGAFSGTVLAANITAGTITGSTVQSSSGTSRVVLDSGDEIHFWDGGSKKSVIRYTSGALEINSVTFGADRLNLKSAIGSWSASSWIDINAGGDLYLDGQTVVRIRFNGTDKAIFLTSSVQMQDVYDNTVSGSPAANVNVHTNGSLRRPVAGPATLKQNIRSVTPDQARTVLQADAVLYDSEGFGPMYGGKHQDGSTIWRNRNYTARDGIGFITEQISHMVDLPMVWRDEPSQVGEINYRSFTVIHNVLLADHETRIAALEAAA